MKRICGSCKDPVSNAEMHPKLKVWLCTSCTIRLREAARVRGANRAAALKPDSEIRHMMKTNKKPDGW